MDPMRITVLAGGPSAEREVSLVGGRAVADALASLGHDVALRDITPDNLSALDRPGVDLVFPVLHGTWGEDGRLQRILDDRGLPYVGSGPEASALAMNKAESKSAFVAAGLPTPAWQVWSGWPDGPVGWDGPWPVVVKPLEQGSSVDLFIPADAEAMRQAVGAVCGRYQRCLVEQFIAGRELTVGVLGAEALPPIEIRVSADHAYYDYHAKYVAEDTSYTADPDLPDGCRAALGERALAAHGVLGCRDYSRVDFLLDQRSEPLLLEVNTIPGFTSHSLLPMAARAIGLDFTSLCGRLVEIAWRRTARSADLRSRSGD